METAQKVFLWRYRQKLGIPLLISWDGLKVTKMPSKGLVCLHLIFSQAIPEVSASGGLRREMTCVCWIDISIILPGFWVKGRVVGKQFGCINLFFSTKLSYLYWIRSILYFYFCLKCYYNLYFTRFSFHFLNTPIKLSAGDCATAQHSLPTIAILTLLAPFHKWDCWNSMSLR